MSQKAKTYTNLIKSEVSFFSYARCIFSRYGKKEKSLALYVLLSLLVSIFTSQFSLFGYVQVGVPLPVFLLSFQLLFVRKPKNPV
jgi:hypothetical protein